MAQPSLVGEIAERLAALQLGAERSRHMVVVVPIKPGALEAVRRLLAAGPPFDPAQLAELDRHEVFLTETEVIFLFESRLGFEALAPVLTEPEVWATAGALSEHVAGALRVGEEVYSWKAGDVPGEPGEVFYLPTPGPGDSDGGDIF